MKYLSLTPKFVETIPEDLEAGILYVSIRYRTASHLCACGCGSKVVTPIKPAKWHLTYDGEAVSLSPSIGRWQLPCRSHYWVRKNKVVPARPFSENEMQAVRQKDAEELRDYYSSRQGTGSQPAAEQVAMTSRRGLRRRVRNWFRANID